MQDRANILNSSWNLNLWRLSRWANCAGNCESVCNHLVDIILGLCVLYTHYKFPITFPSSQFIENEATVWPVLHFAANTILF